MRPLLLLDVGGVLSPTGPAVPPGFERHVGPTHAVALSAAHGPAIRELAALFDVVWATTWGHQANTVIAPLLGIAPLPVLELGDLPRDGTRKLGAVRASVGDRALAWVDDELYDDARAWADARAAPTVLRRTRGAVGLRPEDVEALRDFALSPRTPRTG